MYDLDALDNTTFSWDTALALALASDLAYQQGVAVRNIATQNWGFAECTFLSQADTQCFVARSDTAILVAFRGSESFNDWIADLTVLPTTKSYGRVHSGFATAYEAVAGVLEQTIRGYRPAGKVLHFTGHSLGAALATIAACELADRFQIAGIYTFGQPRLGNDATAQFVQTNYPQKFQRFVFDDDLVTRIPPGYVHVGRLLHFDEHGLLRVAAAAEAMVGAAGARPAPAGEASAGEPPAMNDDEFARLQETARQIRAQAPLAAAATGESAEEVADRSFEGWFPSVRDHRMTNYIFALRNYAQASKGASEAQVMRAAESFAKSALSLQAPGGQTVLAPGDKVPVLVRARRHAWRPPTSTTINSQNGPIFSLLADEAEIRGMQQDEDVRSVEVSREVDPETSRECAVSVPYVRGNEVHAPPIDERGDQAIVGLIDTGIDVLHEAFLDGAGNSRIDAVWVQSDRTGPTPKQVDPARYSQNYGTLYQSADIRDFVQGRRAVPATLRDPDPVQGRGGHGAHVASIAAGKAVGTFGGGMAPEARIVAVAPYMKTTPPDPPSLGYSNSHQDALNFLMAYKKAVGLPMAVNVSQGMNAGAHDGMSLLEKVFDSVTLKGREEGFVIVKSAGNERGYQGHAKVQAAVGGMVTIEWTSANLERPLDYLEFWYGSTDQLQFTLVDPSGRSSPMVSHADGNRSASYTSADNDVQLELTLNHADNDDHLLTVRIAPVARPIQPGTWVLEIQATAVGAGQGMVHGWVERDHRRPLKFTAGAVDEMTMSVPGTADTVIAVAATNTSRPPLLARYSSYGPTRKNGPKPDLHAPGDSITAACSNTPDRTAVISLSGTSMAAPHVTGALALVLSARHKKCQLQPGKRQFNAINLAGMLKRSASNHTGVHHPGYGFGGLDAKAFFDEADGKP